MSLPPPSLIVVLGPTGAGKSELALTLAEHFAGEIIGCDSVQVYRGFDIGSAKLPLPERRGIPHHLIDIIGPEQEITAGSYSQLARQAISAIHANGHLSILTGGTGFYLRALLDGLSPAPVRDDALRARLKALSERQPRALHRFLLRHDPVAAERIHPNDHQKLIRAVELISLSRQPASQIQSAPRQALSGVVTLKLGLLPSRDLLYDRLNDRCSQMFARGLLDETAALLAGGCPPDAKPLQSLGYKQASDCLRQRLSLPAAIDHCQTKTRQYAKRQMTWFRREPGVIWLAGFGGDPPIEKQAIDLTQAFLRQTFRP